MLIVTPEQMKALEKDAYENYYLNESMVIETVGSRGADYLYRKFFSQLESADCVILVGKGNNGADALCIARHMLRFNIHCHAVYFHKLEEASDECQKQMQAAKAHGIRIYDIHSTKDLESFFLRLPDQVVFIDGILGTGARLPLPSFLYEVIDLVNQYSSYTISLDIPTGVCGKSGEVDGSAIKASLTLALGYPKLGFYVDRGPQFVGKVKTLDIALPKFSDKEGKHYLLHPKQLGGLVTNRDKFADKKKYGHSLIMGGSHGLTGALVLASKAALKVGAGLTTAATWENQYMELIPRLIPEVMTGYIPMDEGSWKPIVDDLNRRFDSIVIGPGLARSTRARKLVLTVLETFQGPVVLDADAINVLKLEEDASIFTMRDYPTLLTPHLGEFARFIGKSKSEIEKRTTDILEDVIHQINCTIVLKGPCTFIAHSSGRTYFNYFPNDGMATGGSGDVLAGILGGLLCQQAFHKDKTDVKKLEEVINLAITLHSLAGHFAAQKEGVRAMTASSIINYFDEGFAEIKKYTK